MNDKVSIENSHTLNIYNKVKWVHIDVFEITKTTTTHSTLAAKSPSTLSLLKKGLFFNSKKANSSQLNLNKSITQKTYYLSENDGLKFDSLDRLIE